VNECKPLKNGLYELFCRSADDADELAADGGGIAAPSPAWLPRAAAALTPATATAGRRSDVSEDSDGGGGGGGSGGGSGGGGGDGGESDDTVPGLRGYDDDAVNTSICAFAGISPIVKASPRSTVKARGAALGWWGGTAGQAAGAGAGRGAGGGGGGGGGELAAAGIARVGGGGGWPSPAESSIGDGDGDESVIRRSLFGDAAAPGEAPPAPAAFGQMMWKDPPVTPSPGRRASPRRAPAAAPSPDALHPGSPSPVRPHRRRVTTEPRVAAAAVAVAAIAAVSDSADLSTPTRRKVKALEAIATEGYREASSVVEAVPVALGRPALGPAAQEPARASAEEPPEEGVREEAAAAATGPAELVAAAGPEAAAAAAASAGAAAGAAAADAGETRGEAAASGSKVARCRLNR